MRELKMNNNNLILPEVAEHKKYPKTWYLEFSDSIGGGDKIQYDLSGLVGRQIVVTEKMDGENTTMYFDKIHARSLDSNNHPSRSWVKALHANIQYSIPQNMKICGENMYAEHSISYNDLESYFLVFNIWDGDNILDWNSTINTCNELGLKTVPVLYEGVFDIDALKEIAKNLDFSKQEGFVVRPQDGFHKNDFTKNILKYVRKNHVTTDEHWMTKPMVKNFLKKKLQD